MKNNIVKIEKITVPSWQAFLFISLFNGDGGDGFTDDEIEEAQSMIKENNYYSLTEVSEPVDGEIEFTFIIG